ncbi:MAG: carbohydrate kinase [Clostridia bacterium]|nr:carbohydrate kinase [Clostridia bacterium]
MKITAIGEILVDMTQTQVDGRGIRHFAANPGGAPANVAVAAAKLGAESAFIGCVGDDVFGQTLKETLLSNGVDVSGLQVTEKASTTLAVVTVDEKGERSFSFCRRPGADTRLDAGKAAEAAAGTGILHFGSVSLTDPDSRQATVCAVRAAKEAGAIITYDPNYRASLWPDRETAVREMRAPLPLCDIVKISDEETELLCGVSDPRDAARVLCEGGAKLVLVTLGAEGAFWRCGEESGVVPGCRVKVADTNGAGDTFFGALLSRIALRGGLQDLDAQEITGIVAYANRAAALTTSRPGAIPAMPTREELEG